MITPDFASNLDSAHPWPGLMSFEEDGKDFFFGRDDEISEALRIIRRDTLTILFGQSGLGKTSLLNAGVFPALRLENYFPIPVRLDVARSAPSFRTQINRAIQSNCAKHKVEAPEIPPDASLWEYFHSDATDFWSFENQLLRPVLVFDQFEEIFTLGRYSPELREECDSILTELGDLVENRIPLSMQEKYESNDSRFDLFNFEKSMFRVVFCFREDYLADFEGLKNLIRRSVQNRMRLMPMRVGAAIRAIGTAGANLISADAAQTIVTFVAGVQTLDNRQDENLVEPALLSLVCRELNETRIRLKNAQISTDLITAGNAEKIIEDYYKDCFRLAPKELRWFVEDRLLTKSGFRDSCSLEEVMGQPGIAEQDVERLVQRRLIRYDIRHGVRRIELTHDILTKVASQSRDVRQINLKAERALHLAQAAQAEAEKLRVLHADAKHYLGLALSEKAEKAFSEKRKHECAIFAVHALANIDPVRAPSEYISSLGRRLSAIQYKKEKLRNLFFALRCVERGNEVAIVTDRLLEFYHPSTLHRTGAMAKSVSGVVQVEFAQNGKFIATRTRSGRIEFWEMPGYMQRKLAIGEGLSATCMAFSRTGRYLALGFSTGGIRVINTADGTEVGEVRHERSFEVSNPPVGLVWSPQEKALIAFSSNKTTLFSGALFSQGSELLLGSWAPMEVRQSQNHLLFSVLAQGRILYNYEIVERDTGWFDVRQRSNVSGNAEPYTCMAVSPNGVLLAVGYGSTVRLIDFSSGVDLASLDCGTDLVLSLDFSFDGKWLIAGSRGSDLVRWEIPSFDWAATARSDEIRERLVLEGVKVRHMTHEEIAASN